MKGRWPAALLAALWCWLGLVGVRAYVERVGVPRSITRLGADSWPAEAPVRRDALHSGAFPVAGEGPPPGWRWHEPEKRAGGWARVVAEPGRTPLLRLGSADPASSVCVESEMRLQPAWRSLEVWALWRARGYRQAPGPVRLHAGVMGRFQDEKGAELSWTIPVVLREAPEHEDWLLLRGTWPIPPRARSLAVVLLQSLCSGESDCAGVLVAPAR